MKLPSHGRLAVYDAPNAPFRIERYPLRPPAPGEALARIRMSTICRSDIHSWQGQRPNPCPGVLGHEISGDIVALGAGVTADMRGDALAPGDRALDPAMERGALLDANLILKKLLTLRGVHNYHPRNLVEALDFVVAHRVLRAAIVP